MIEFIHSYVQSRNEVIFGQIFVWVQYYSQPKKKKLRKPTFYVNINVEEILPSIRELPVSIPGVVFPRLVVEHMYRERGTKSVVLCA